MKLEKLVEFIKNSETRRKNEVNLFEQSIPFYIENVFRLKMISVENAGLGLLFIAEKVGEENVFYHFKIQDACRYSILFDNEITLEKIISGNHCITPNKEFILSNSLKKKNSESVYFNKSFKDLLDKEKSLDIELEFAAEDLMKKLSSKFYCKYTKNSYAEPVIENENFTINFYMDENNHEIEIDFNKSWIERIIIPYHEMEKYEYEIKIDKIMKFLTCLCNWDIQYDNHSISQLHDELVDISIVCNINSSEIIYSENKELVNIVEKLTIGNVFKGNCLLAKLDYNLLTRSFELEINYMLNEYTLYANSVGELVDIIKKLQNSFN